ncbi:MAG: hypothetical protein AB1571_03525 [Nanoarchaeota archaeon]
MKKLFLIFLLIIPTALAIGQTINLDDFFTNPVQTTTLGERDRIAFRMLEGEHTIIIDKIADAAIDLSIFPYLKENMFVTITPNKYLRLDLNKDHIIDLIVKLKDINGKNVTVSLEKVSIDERTPYEKKYNTSYYNTTPLYTKKEESKTYAILLLIIAGTIVILSLIPSKIYKKIYKRFKK